jgi:hypothetical protein
VREEKVMPYYAYKTDKNGERPLGTLDHLFSDRHKTDRGFMKYARRILGATAKAYRYYNFYDDKTFTELKEGRR